MTLDWEFHREIAASGASLGGCVHYFDESAQSMYLTGGKLMARTGEVPFGHWATAELGAPVQIAGDYARMALDHPANGAIYGIAADAAGLYVLRYVYAMDMTDITESGSWQEQIDNQIKQLQLTVKNVGPNTFTAENTLFNPGAKIAVRFAAGDSSPYAVGVAYLDEVEFDAYGSTVPVSGRNVFGTRLSDQTFDDLNSYGGARDTVVRRILEDAGVTDVLIQPNSSSMTVLFDPSKDILTGLNEALAELGWRMVDDATGRVIVGDETFLTTNAPSGRYVFNGGSEVFLRRTSKRIDAAYTRVCVRREDGAVYRTVPSWDHWQTGARKTKYIDAPEGADLEALADKAVAELQYVGIGEQFSAPIRPQIQVGDTAEIHHDGDTETTTLGIITEITHQFGDRGFITNFSVDSGGAATGEYEIVSQAAALDGYNRRQRVLDFVALVAAKKAVAVYAGGGQVKTYPRLVEASSIAPASIMCSI